MNWYAVKVFFNRLAPVLQDMQTAGIECFDSSGVVPSLLFLRCEGEWLERYAYDHWQQLMPYRSMATKKPLPIPDREMSVFRFVVTAGKQGLELLGDDRPEYHLGDRVMVTDGPFKGAEGHIYRIRRDRRLVVAITGVVAVATTYIHPSLLRKIE